MHYKHIINLIFVIFFNWDICSQSCLPGTTYFSTQAQIDAFPTNYPGCTTISGTLFITGSNITNLSPLSQISAINGNLFVLNTSLQSLNGFQNLQSIGGALNLVGNSMLSNLSPFNPSNIGNNIQFGQNAILNAIELNNISNNINGLLINDNPLLISLQMNNLNSISFASGGEFHIVRNPLMSSLEMNNLNTINIQGYGSINFEDNPLLNQINFTNANEINSYYFLIDNCGFTNLNFLNGINGTIGALEIKNNSSLSTIENIIINITNSLIINNNDLLTNLSGVNNIIELSELNISNNNLLTSLTGLESITSLGNLLLYNNPALSSLSGLNNVLNMTGPTLLIENNPLLENFTSLNPNVVSHFNDIKIKNNSLLNNVSNLNNENNYGYFSGLEIEMNPLLNSLDGIYSTDLPYIENHGNFKIASNAAILSLSGLDSIYNYGTIEIQNNPNLDECDIWGICTVIADCGPGCFNISNNATNCINYNAVQTACNAILPVDLMSLSVKNISNHNYIHWQTSSEINNHYFDVEHSTNGTEFTLLGREGGMGNSTTLSEYHFAHKDVEAGLHYYRLKQVDYDGKYNYSDVVKVKIINNKNGQRLFVAPNPIKRGSTFSLHGLSSEDSRIVMYDVYGQVAPIICTSNNFEYSTNVPQGTYFIKDLSNGNYTKTIVIE